MSRSSEERSRRDQLARQLYGITWDLATRAADTDSDAIDYETVSDHLNRGVQIVHRMEEKHEQGMVWDDQMLCDAMVEFLRAYAAIGRAARLAPQDYTAMNRAGRAEQQQLRDLCLWEVES